MYHCKLNIVVLSMEPFLEKLTNSVSPLEQFEHTVQAYSELSLEQLSNGDIILLDIPLKKSLLEIRKACKKNAKLILCDESKVISLLSDEELEAVDEFWEKPFREHFTAIRFHKLLKSIKLQKDYYLCQTYLDTAIDSIPDMVWFKDKHGSHLKVNKAFCHTVGKTREDVTGKDHCYIWNVSREDFERGEFVCQETENIVMQMRKTCQFNEKVKSQHGMRQFKTYKSPLFGESGEIMGTVGIGHDVTDLENMGAELEIILRSMPFAILVRNDDGVIINANEKFEKYFGIRKESVIEKNYETWASKTFIGARRINDEGYEEAIIIPSNSSESKTLEVHEDPIYDVFHNIVGRLCIYRDITMERELEQQILKNSNTDFMTGLYNRRCFYQYISKNRKDKPINLLYVDLDHFKQVNDTYGHQTGDEALIKTADILRECFVDKFIARLGGDEFIIAILGKCSLEDLEEKAQRLLDRMREVFSASKKMNILSASIGIAQSDDPKMNIDILIQQSDTALYEAKQNGKSQYRVYRHPENEE